MKQAIVALAAAILVSTPALASDSAAAVETAASALQANKFVWSDPASAEPVTIVVSIPQQRAFVYRGDALVAASAVSTGRIGNDTPTGVYPILQKNEKHRSNLYDDAPMPYMQRLTWDGIALHAGKNPGFPDSHGCVRLPMEFARKLFAITQKGTTVVVTDMEVEGATLDRELLVTETRAPTARRWRCSTANARPRREHRQPRGTGIRRDRASDASHVKSAEMIDGSLLAGSAARKPLRQAVPDHTAGRLDHPRL